MKRQESSASRWRSVAAIVFSVGLVTVWADVDPSRYGSIVERNPFQLKPPPPPPDPASLAPPPVPIPPATVELTGITSILSSKKALLEIIPGPGKQMIKPVLSEGEKIESVEVVSIDVDKNQVVIKNNGLLTNLTFKVVKSTPTPPPGQPQQANASVVPAKPVIPGVPQPQQPALNYTQPSTGGRSGVIMTGGNPSYQDAAVSAAGVPGANGLSTLQNNPNAGFRSIPSRTIRSGGVAPQTIPGQTGQAEQPPPVDPAQAYINMKAQAEWAKQRGIVMPPPPTIPGVE